MLCVGALEIGLTLGLSVLRAKMNGKDKIKNYRKWKAVGDNEEGRRHLKSEFKDRVEVQLSEEFARINRFRDIEGVERGWLCGCKESKKSVKKEEVEVWGYHSKIVVDGCVHLKADSNVVVCLEEDGMMSFYGKDKMCAVEFARVVSMGIGVETDKGKEKFVVPIGGPGANIRNGCEVLMKGVVYRQNNVAWLGPGKQSSILDCGKALRLHRGEDERYNAVAVDEGRWLQGSMTVEQIAVSIG